MPVSIYDHTDYRRYLREWFEDKKGRPSLRGFAKKVDCSPALLSSVMGGTRDLAPALVEKVAEALGLDAEEKPYFLSLVEWEQAATMKQRRQALERVMAARRFKSARRIVDAMYLIFSRWYYPVVLELARCEGFRDDPAWIAGVTMPRITPEEAAEALGVLVETGFLARGADGKLHPADVLWATEHEVNRITGPALFDMHRWLAGRAPQALDEVPGDERYFSTASLALSDAAFAELKQTLARFDEEALARFGSVDAPSRVYQLSVQLYPLSRPTRG